MIKRICFLALVTLIYSLFESARSNAFTVRNDMQAAQNTKDTCHELVCYIKNKSTIPKNVMKVKTVLAPQYLKNSTVTFTGDEIFEINKNYSGYTVVCNDGGCTYRFLLIMNITTGENTDYMTVFRICDTDDASNFISNSFSIESGQIELKVDDGNIDYKVNGSGKLEKE